VVDADAIARELTAAGGLAMPEIVATFGPVLMMPSGALDRDSMRALAFTDATARQRLESIIHPMVGRETEKQASIAAGEGRTSIVFDIPLLVESSGWRQKLDHVLVVDCTPEVQISRVMARSQLTRDAIEKIMTSQASRIRRLSAADTVIFNVGLTLNKLTDEVRQISHRFGLSLKPQLAFEEKTA
jgi:dephospho-CoA kinase